jgi:hypothetical protein
LAEVFPHPHPKRVIIREDEALADQPKVFITPSTVGITVDTFGLCAVIMAYMTRTVGKSLDETAHTEVRRVGSHTFCSTETGRRRGRQSAYKIAKSTDHLVFRLSYAQ